MSSLFALQGPGNCGKSTTLINLYQALQAKYPSATVQNLHGGTSDICVIIRGVSGLVVGIESQGDPNSRLQASLPAFANANCHIIFCACRTSGMTVNWVNSLSASYTINFVRQTYTNVNQASTNTATAFMLMQQAGI